MSLDRLPRGLTDVRDQAQQFAEDGKVFLFTTDKIGVATDAETATLLIKNPSGSAIKIKILSLAKNMDLQK